MRPRHPLRGRGRRVVVTGEMKQPVQGVEKHFVFNLEIMVGRLCAGHGGTDEDFPVRKRDDVGFRRITEERIVHPSHRGTIDQDKLEIGEVIRQGPGQQVKRRLKPPQ